MRHEVRAWMGGGVKIRMRRRENSVHGMYSTLCLPHDDSYAAVTCAGKTWDCLGAGC